MKELEKKFMAELKGGSVMAINRPLQLQVSASVKSDTFWAVTKDVVERLVAKGIRMQGGTFIPWDNIRVGREVLIRQLDIKGMPVSFIEMKSIEAKSLSKRRLF